MAPATPIIIGVADIVNRSPLPREPLDLISNAIANALADTSLAGPRLGPHVDDLTLIRSWTWPYDDLPGLVAERTGLVGARRTESPHGGNQPVKCLEQACRRITRGESKVAVLAGGEALGSLSDAARKGKIDSLRWTPTSTPLEGVFSPTTRALDRGVGARHAIGAPLQIYPLYENALRAHRAQSVRANHEESAELYAEFARVAEGNMYAWNYARKVGKEVIGTVTKGNRMVCWPYPLLMNAFNNVNLAAAVVVTSTDMARELGIHEDRWIYVRGMAGTSESAEFWKRSSFHHAPAISESLDAALRLSGLSEKDIDLYDFYSCFPIVPKLACRHLDIPLVNGPKPITLLGGLTSFGGAGNNYSMHALTEMTRRLRARHKSRRQNGLVLANGGVLTYQHAAVLSSHPGDDKVPHESEASLDDPLTLPCPEVVEEATGEAVIETYTVDFDRKGTPARGHIVGRLAGSKARFLANHGDQLTLRKLVSQDVESIGQRGMVRYDAASGRNVFTLETLGAGSKL